MNFPQSWCGVPQGHPQLVVPTSWFKMAARASAEHLSSRKEAEQCDGEGRAKKAPLQFSVPLLMSPEIHFHLPVHTHPQDRLEGNTVSRMSVLQLHIKCISINKKKERMTDNQEFLLQSLSHPKAKNLRFEGGHVTPLCDFHAHCPGKAD